jgi:hypothetical protein
MKAQQLGQEHCRPHWLLQTRTRRVLQTHHRWCQQRYPLQLLLNLLLAGPSSSWCCCPALRRTQQGLHLLLQQHCLHCQQPLLAYLPPSCLLPFRCPLQWTQS